MKLSLEECQILAKSRNFVCLENEYISMITPMKWKCNVCNNEWNARFANIKFRKSGCPRCNALLINKNRLLGIDHCRIEGEKRGFKLIENESLIYKNNNIPMKWKCSNGHIFDKDIHHMKRGGGCVFCDRERKMDYEKNNGKYCLIGKNEYYFFTPFIESFFREYIIEKQYIVYQKGFRPFYVDFLIKELNLAVEYDEKAHKSTKRKYRYDYKRQEYIEKQLKVSFIRVNDEEFMKRGMEYFAELYNKWNGEI